jgi:prepilin-type N-terminal cleavage/methylation domain-containing protein
MNGRTAKTNRPAFTLLELLVVILIIGMLMALLSTAVFRARTVAQNAAVTLEANSLSQGVVTFLDRHASGNAQPPDFGEIGNAQYQNTVLLPFIRQAFPRYTGATTYASWQQDVRNQTGLNTDNLDPSEALPFWLGGVPRPGTLELTGFSQNPYSPFTPSMASHHAAYRFHQTRLVDLDRDGWPEYQPQGHGQLRGPFVYFARRRAPTQDQFFFGRKTFPAGAGLPTGVARPYLELIKGTTPYAQWANVDTFQIIAPGIDNDYGADAPDKTLPVGTNFGIGDFDNLSNFTSGKLKE